MKTGVITVAVVDTEILKIVHKGIPTTVRNVHPSMRGARTMEKLLNSSQAEATTAEAEVSETEETEEVSKECVAEAAVTCQCEDEDAVTSHSEETAVAETSEVATEATITEVASMKKKTRTKTTECMMMTGKETLLNESHTRRATIVFERQTNKDVGLR